MKKLRNQFIKFTIVGTVNTLIDLTALYCFVEYLHINVILASILSFLIAATNSFFFNKTWTFKNSSLNYRNQVLKFIIVSGIGLTLNTIFMYMFVQLIGLWYMFSKVLTSGIVLIWNFIGNKFWTFSK